MYLEDYFILSYLCAYQFDILTSSSWIPTNVDVVKYVPISVVHVLALA